MTEPPVQTVVIAGASGFIGTYFRRRFAELRIEVRTIGRSRQTADAVWGDTAGIAQTLDGADLLLNLAGKSVSCRYNRVNKAEIFRSRLETTAELGRALAACAAEGGRPPSLWINASIGTIYRHAEDRPQSEDDGELGSGFSVDVARAWEQALDDADAPGVRKVALRIAIVLGPGGGVMRPFVNLARCGLGGRQGKGTQQFSWIHVEDLLQVILFLAAPRGLAGAGTAGVVPVNAASPHPVTNRELMAEVRRALRIPLGLPAPKWLLELGAVLIRTETELVLKSRWVEPRRLLDAGYRSRYPTLRQALAQILGSYRSPTMGG
jgi:uncharacterized protein